MRFLGHFTRIPQEISEISMGDAEIQHPQEPLSLWRQGVGWRPPYRFTSASEEDDPEDSENPSDKKKKKKRNAGLRRLRLSPPPRSW